MSKVDNAVIMAAGTSSRFAPLSYERPKALINVKGEVLIERQIKQLREAGIKEIYIVTGYKAEAFGYLIDKFGIHLRNNPYYDFRNNNASIKAVEDILSNTYVCSADNYFNQNPFEKEVSDAYYAAVYSDGPTNEWCISTDQNGWIKKVTIGGTNSWYMLGHTFWDAEFSKKFTKILEAEYNWPETADKLWEDIYLEHIDQLHMKMKKYPSNYIYEFDTLDELRLFDTSYISDTRSTILKNISNKLKIHESDICNVKTIKDMKTTEAIGFTFEALGQYHTYFYDEGLQK